MILGNFYLLKLAFNILYPFAKKRARTLPIKVALKALKEEEAAKLINEEEIRASAVELAEQTGIVFIDEIDKVANRNDQGGAGVSREGVQRDLLPLIEGSTVSTKYGSVKTDHILFIATSSAHALIFLRKILHLELKH